MRFRAKKPLVVVVNAMVCPAMPIPDNAGPQTPIRIVARCQRCPGSVQCEFEGALYSVMAAVEFEDVDNCS